MIDIEVLQNAAEVIRYQSPEIPYAIQSRKLSQFTDMRALCHWHEDLELLYIFEGEMLYDINGKILHLHAGDILIVNSHQMHFGYAYHERECIFTCMLFHPELLKCNLYMYQKYVQPIINAPAIEYWYFTKDRPAPAEFVRTMQDLYDACLRHSLQDYRVISAFYLLWNVLYHQCDASLYTNPMAQDPDIHLQKEMITYITQHYSEAVTLEDIAASANISRSKCCQIFKKYMQQAPITYLNIYRMDISCSLLRNTSYSITSIALSCGFNHLSYFSKMFLKKYGCTPKEYRKQHAADLTQPSRP